MTHPSVYYAQKRSLLLLILVCCLGLAKAQNGTLHALMLIDEHSDIAPACISDKFKMEEEVQIIAQKTRMNLNLVNIDYERVNVEKVVNELSVGENDVIFFYFTGHGYRYEDQKSCGQYPYLYISKQKEHLYEAGICLESIDQQLQAKGARLVITLADCCNNVLPYEEPIAMNTSVIGEVYKKLFLLSEGHVLATSSLPGQFSFATNNGGYFTNSFLESIREYANINANYEDLDWDTILKKTTAKTIISSDSKQKPQFKALVKSIEEEAIPGMVILPEKN